MAIKQFSKQMTVGELAEQWSVTVAKIRCWINRGDLIARNISADGKRATWRVDAGDAESFWNSLSNRNMRGHRKTKPVIASGSYDDFI